LPYNFGQQIPRTIVSKLMRHREASPDSSAGHGQPLRQRANVLDSGYRFKVVLGQVGRRHYLACSAIRDAPQCRYALGDVVCLPVQPGRYQLEQLMQLLELKSLHVPVCMLRVRPQICDFSQAGVEQLDHLRARGFCEIKLGLE
jgi:hypothetical protein